MTCPVVIGRRVTRNAHLNDGTPRRETGFRPYVETSGPDSLSVFGYDSGPQKRIFIGPLFKEYDGAMAWLPDFVLENLS